MHYSITKKPTLSLHVKNIDIKNYAINSATAVVFKNPDSREAASVGVAVVALTVEVA